jgi:hypothetical protein
MIFKRKFSEEQYKILMRPIRAKQAGGYQLLLERLQKATDPITMTCQISVDDARRIADYSIDYGEGGYQSRLRQIFPEGIRAEWRRQLNPPKEQQGNLL